MSSRARYPKFQNNQTPARWFKRKHNRMWKSMFKRQFNRWLNNPNYEIIEQSRNHSARWEWN